MTFCVRPIVYIFSLSSRSTIAIWLYGECRFHKHRYRYSTCLHGLSITLTIYIGFFCVDRCWTSAFSRKDPPGIIQKLLLFHNLILSLLCYHHDYVFRELQWKWIFVQASFSYNSWPYCEWLRVLGSIAVRFWNENEILRRIRFSRQTSILKFYFLPKDFITSDPFKYVKWNFDF